MIYRLYDYNKSMSIFVSDLFTLGYYNIQRVQTCAKEVHVKRLVRNRPILGLIEIGNS